MPVGVGTGGGLTCGLDAEYVPRGEAPQMGVCILRWVKSGSTRCWEG